MAGACLSGAGNSGAGTVPVSVCVACLCGGGVSVWGGELDGDLCGGSRVCACVGGVHVCACGGVHACGGG